MASNKKVSQLPVADSVETTDLIAIVSDPGGTPITKQATISQIAALGGGVGAGSNLGTALEVFKDVSEGALRHRTVRIAGDVSSEQDPDGYDGEIHLRPVMPGHYNPRDYGAVFDESTDDLWAFQAMHDDIPITGGVVQLPPGKAWLSNTWQVSKPIQIRGVGGNGAGNGFRLAPARLGISLEGVNISLDGNDAESAHVTHIDVDSQLPVHPTAYGSAGGRGLSAWYVGMPVRQGELVVATAEAHPTIAFRASFSGHTAETSSGTEPTWPTTIGATVAEGSITWTVEGLPFVRASLTPYLQGARVYGVDDNRYIYVCTTAGTSAAAAPGDMLGDKVAVGVQIGGTVTDGSVVWTCTLASGIFVATSLAVIDHIFAHNITGAVVHVQGGTGQNVLGTTFADCVRVRSVTGLDCGLVVYFGGNDANAWTATDIFGSRIGWLQPIPNAQGHGGHVLHDHADAGGTASSLTGQTCSGRSILKTGNGYSTFFSCYQENDLYCYFKGGESVIIGGTVHDDDTSVNLLQLNTRGGRGLVETTGDLSAWLSDSVTPRTHGFTSATDSGQGYSWTHGYVTPTGWWGMQFQPFTVENAFCLSSIGAVGDAGVGWLDFPKGYLTGDPSTVTPTFRGSLASIDDRLLRGGLRVVGDVFADGTTEIIITSAAGYRGQSWTVNTAMVQDYAPWDRKASVVEPTATYGQPGGQVWKCTVAGTTHATTEPTWPASPTVGVTTVSDGTVTWTYLGTAPEYVKAVTKRVTTANATPVYETLYTLATSEVRAVDVIAKIVKADGSVRQAFRLSANIYSNAGTATLDGGSLTDASPRGTGTAAAALDLSGASIRLKITGIAATDLVTTYEASVV